MITASQINWIAGLLEGEGTFNFSTAKRPSIRIALSMTDKDVIEKFANIVGFGVIYKIDASRYGVSKKSQYRWECAGNRAAGLMMTVYSLLGERRQARIRELLDYWKSTQSRHSAMRERKVFAFS